MTVPAGMLAGMPAGTSGARDARAVVAPTGGRLVPLPRAAGGEPALLEAPVLRNDRLGDRYVWLRLDAPAVARRALPGQFVMLTAARDADPGPVLPRPMALLDWDAGTGHVDVVYGVVGEGTARLASFAPGERMVTVGPLGRGFDLDAGSRRVLLVGRGIGTCSLTALARAAAGRGVEVVALDSARHPGALVGRSVYRDAGLDELIEVTDADGGSEVTRVEDRLRAVLRGRPVQQVFTCGSGRLFDLCRRLAADTDADLQVSLEAHMACGLGYCHGCSTGRRSDEAEDPLICRDGPVFRWRDT